MKHKYVFSKDAGAGELMIREYAELNKDIFSPVCETAYELKRFETAFARGPEALMAEMRTQNFYPPGSFLEKIVPGITNAISSDGQEMVEVYCDDTEFLKKSLGGRGTFDAIEDEEDETLDDFIDVDIPDAFDEDVKSGGVSSSDTSDIEEDIIDEGEI